MSGSPPVIVIKVNTSKAGGRKKAYAVEQSSTYAMPL